MTGRDSLSRQTSGFTWGCRLVREHSILDVIGCMAVSASEEARSVHGLDFAFNQSPYSVPIIWAFTDLPLYPSTWLCFPTNVPTEYCYWENEPAPVLNWSVSICINLGRPKPSRRDKVQGDWRVRVSVFGNCSVETSGLHRLSA
jgi:hypothetical protein